VIVGSGLYFYFLEWGTWPWPLHQLMHLAALLHSSEYYYAHGSERVDTCIDYQKMKSNKVFMKF
jgi:hypothetical protein